jgi:hypothetical protein
MTTDLTAQEIKDDEDDTPLLSDMDDLSLRIVLQTAADRIEETEPDVGTDLLNAMQYIIDLRRQLAEKDGRIALLEDAVTCLKEGRTTAEFIQEPKP